MNAPVIALDHPAALDAPRVGPEAASLAAARAAGLPVVPGVVLTADWCIEDRATAELVWRITSHDGQRSMVMRPSDLVGLRHNVGHPSTTAATTVVRDVDDLLHAASAWRAGGYRTAPLLLHADQRSAWSGALFAEEGAGRRATSLVVARGAAGDDWIASVDDAGRIRDRMTPATETPSARLLGRLARLATRAADHLGGPQDLEWTADRDDRVSLVRIRPIVRLRAASDTRVARRGPCRVATPLRPVVGRPRPIERTRERDRRVA